MTLRYVIPLPPVTKKNSQRILYSRKNKRPFIAPSSAYVSYARDAKRYLVPRPLKPIQSAVSVRCVFYMPTRRKADLTNLLEAVDDILVERGILADDSYSIIPSHDGSRVMYDKHNPRTEIYIDDYWEDEFMYRFAINDETFDEVRDALDAMLEHTIESMKGHNSSEGQVTMKLNITMDTDKIIEDTGEVREITIPKFRHTISSAVAHKSSIGGEVTAERELVWDKGNMKWAMTDIGGEQESFFGDDE